VRLISTQLQALLLLVGTIVGAGMFGIPFVFSRAGFLVGAAELVILAGVMCMIHAAYAEVVLRTPELHRLPGYVSYYLGRKVGWLARTSYIFGLSGTLLAYVVLGGIFLGGILGRFFPALPAFAGPAAFYLFGIAVIARSIRFESLVNAVLTAGLVAAVAAFSFRILPDLSLTDLLGVPGSLGLWRWAVPYGVIIFSLAGAAVIPDVRRVLTARNLRHFGRVALWGTLIPAGLYILFAAAVVGVTGEATTPDAVSGLAGRLGSGAVLAGNIIGFLAAITSFITLGLVFEGMLITDFGFRPHAAWAATAAIPAALYALGFQNFITVIGIVGALAVGIDGILVLVVYRRSRGSGIRPPEFRITIPAWLFWAAIVLLALGAMQVMFR